MSSGRLGPSSRVPSCRRRRWEAQPAGAGEVVDGLADDRLADLLAQLVAVRAARQRGGLVWRGAGRVGGVVVVEAVQFHAQPDQVLQRGRIDVTGHHRDEDRIAGDRLGGAALQPRASPTGTRATAVVS